MHSNRIFRRTIGASAFAALLGASSILPAVSYSSSGGPIGSSVLTSTSSAGTATVTLDLSTASSANIPGDYTYTYSVASLTNNTGGAINLVDFSGILGFAGYAGSSNFGFSAPLISTDPTGAVTSLAYDNGVLQNNSTFFFDSSLPPTGIIGAVMSGDAPGGTTNSGAELIGPGTAGASQASAIAPGTNQITDNANGSITYAFANVASGVWVDPAASGFVYTVNSGSPDFSAITLPTGIIPSASNFIVTPSGGSAVQELGGNTLTFSSSVSQFQITGINPSVGSSSGSAFPLQIFFAGGGAGSFSQTSLSAAPEPSQLGVLALIAIGLAGLVVKARKRTCDEGAE